MDVWAIISGVIVSAAAEYAPRLKDWFLYQLSPNQRFAFVLVFSLASGAGLYLFEVGQGEPFEVFRMLEAALYSWLGSQGMHGASKLAEKNKLRSMADNWYE